MENKFLCVLAGYDDETDAELSRIQNSLYEIGFVGTQTRNLPQHITLGYADTDREEDMKQLLRSVASRYEAFEVSLSHVGIFGGSKVLFAAPDKDEKLAELQRNFGESFGWTPHTTMLIDEPETIYRAVPAVLEQFTPIRGKITSLHLYEFFPTRHILSVSLK